MQDNSGQGFGVGNILINGGLDGNNACWLAYTADGAVILGTYRIADWLVLGPNPGTLSNSQCTVWRGRPGRHAGDDGWPDRVLLSKCSSTPTGRGGKTIYGALRAPGDVSSSGWQAVGTWMQAPSGGNVMTSGLQLGGALQRVSLSYRTPFPDDLEAGQIILSGQAEQLQQRLSDVVVAERAVGGGGSWGDFRAEYGQPVDLYGGGGRNGSGHGGGV
jgi:hypothetical protein